MLKTPSSVYLYGSWLGQTFGERVWESCWEYFGKTVGQMLLNVCVVSWNVLGTFGLYESSPIHLVLGTSLRNFTVYLHTIFVFETHFLQRFPYIFHQTRASFSTIVSVYFLYCNLLVDSGAYKPAFLIFFISKPEEYIYVSMVWSGVRNDGWMMDESGSAGCQSEGMASMVGESPSATLSWFDEPLCWCPFLHSDELRTWHTLGHLHIYVSFSLPIHRKLPASSRKSVISPSCPPYSSLPSHPNLFQTGILFRPTALWNSHLLLRKELLILFSTFRPSVPNFSLFTHGHVTVLFLSLFSLPSQKS